MHEAVVDTTRMNVEVEMWHLLIGAGAGGMPDAQPVGGKDRIDGARDTSNHDEDSCRCLVVGIPQVGQVSARDNENVPWMELTQVEKGDREIILGDDGGGEAAGDDLTERTGSIQG